ncbi:tyrosine-type recombinase/integrase, partial [Staphylococcus pseudintermedius]|nr:tyrosine-type recombinase/integrase [Staphylococcus pseudintermedius]
KSLRHTHCSYLLAQGMTIQYISKRLGHADIHTTLTIYSHLLKEYEDAEDETLIHHLQGLSDS